MVNMKVDWKVLNKKNILVTGASGLLGSMICRVLSIIAIDLKLDMKIIAMSRNNDKTKRILKEFLPNENIIFVEQEIIDKISLPLKCDYIIHTACPTASNTFVNNPVETIEAIVVGTENILKYAKNIECKSVLYLSSMEAYGEILHENLLKPEDVGYINPLNLRSCYSEGKRMAENLCLAYFSEYHIPIKIIRLAQTFGPGIPESDNRVFAQFIHSVIDEKNIVLFTEGKAKRMYLDTLDAVSACITVLLKGENGNVYNAGNPDTYCSIKEMAELVIKEFGKGKSSLIIDTSKNKGQYPPDTKLLLDIEPLKKLDWMPQYSLKQMYERMLKSYKMEGEK